MKPDTGKCLLTKLGQGGQTSVDSQTELHWQFRRDYRGNDQDTVEQKLGLFESSLNSFESLSDAVDKKDEQLTSNPDICTRGDCKDQQEANEQETLEIIGGDTVGREDHRANKLSLRSSK